MGGEQIHKQRPASDAEIDAVVEMPEASETGEVLKTELGDLLDEIDSVLEVNAEDFVKSYIQKGGQ
jgi:prokaryotic ubiquitin-like protein Pup